MINEAIKLKLQIEGIYVRWKQLLLLWYEKLSTKFYDYFSDKTHVYNVSALYLDVKLSFSIERPLFSVKFGMSALHQTNAPSPPTPAPPYPVHQPNHR